MWPEDRPVPRERLLAEACACDGLIVLLSDRVDEAVLGAGRGRLRVVANYAVGHENVDVEAARRLGIAVCNTPDVLTEATADLAFALMLAAARRIPESERLVRAGRWAGGFSPALLLGVPIAGRVLGVVGAGRIGRAVLARGRGFGMDLRYASRRPLAPEDAAAAGARFRPLDDLLAESDFVSLHVPLTPATRHLVSRERLARMKPTAVLVNTSRGPVVDEEALAEALAAGRLHAAGLDVFEREPAVHPRLLALENAVLTPHIGSATHAARAEMARLCCEGVDAVLAGRRPANLVGD